MTNEQYYDCIQPYQNACQIMRAKLEVLNGSLYQKSSVSPIHNIQERIKAKKSIEKKLEKLGHSDSVQNAKDYLRDIAGIRVICYFIDDIYNLVNALKRQSELIFIREKDYIQNPKPNGYRSYHVIIAVPVYYLDIDGIFSGGDPAAYHDHGSVGKYGAPCLLQETSGTQGRAGRGILSVCRYPGKDRGTV